MVVGECLAGRGIREFKEFRWDIIPQKTSMGMDWSETGE